MLERKILLIAPQAEEPLAEQLKGHGWPVLHRHQYAAAMAARLVDDSFFVVVCLEDFGDEEFPSGVDYISWLRAENNSSIPAFLLKERKEDESAVADHGRVPTHTFPFKRDEVDTDKFHNTLSMLLNASMN